MSFLGIKTQASQNQGRHKAATCQSQHCSKRSSDPISPRRTVFSPPCARLPQSALSPQAVTPLPTLPGVGCVVDPLGCGVDPFAFTTSTCSFETFRRKKTETHNQLPKSLLPQTHLQLPTPPPATNIQESQPHPSFTFQSQNYMLKNRL